MHAPRYTINPKKKKKKMEWLKPRDRAKATEENKPTQDKTKGTHRKTQETTKTRINQPRTESNKQTVKVNHEQ